MSETNKDRSKFGGIRVGDIVVANTVNGMQKCEVWGYGFSGDTLTVTYKFQDNHEYEKVACKDCFIIDHVENLPKHFTLNPLTGVFSNSVVSHTDWFFNRLTPAELAEIKDKGFKLITFKCINDPDFEFSKNMKLR